MTISSSFTPRENLPRHTLPYQIHNVERTDNLRQIEVLASPEELLIFRDKGFLARDPLFTPDQVELLRDALESVAVAELGPIASTPDGGRRFGGAFLRHLMDKHPVFLDLFNYQPTLSVARAMLGPQVQVLPMTARITAPQTQAQETHWHFHQRVIPEPMPPFFARPHVIDCLIYLDDLTPDTGPVSVMPGSHHRIHDHLPADSYQDWPGQETLHLRAGGCVMVHGALWHRAHPTRPSHRRRMLILPYAASWLRLPSYGDRPTNPLLDALLPNADAQTRELLGLAEGLY